MRYVVRRYEQVEGLTWWIVREYRNCTVVAKFGDILPDAEARARNLAAELNAAEEESK